MKRQNSLYVDQSKRRVAIYNTILGPDTTLCFIDLSDEYATVNIVINAGVKCTFYIVKNTRLY